MSNNILITGATGNVGLSIVNLIKKEEYSNKKWILAVRHNNKNCNDTAIEKRYFDFENTLSFDQAFDGIDILFLLRPPHLANVKKYFFPLLESAKKNGIRKIVFLSVQGAEKKTFIPHAKIEKLIKEFGFEYVFLRPSYFMQNLTTTLKDDIVKGCICLPSGNAVFNWVNIDDIAEIAVKVLGDFNSYKNSAITITGPQNISFPQVVHLINRICGVRVNYKSMSLINFWKYKKRQGEPLSKIMVMILLHFFPRFESEPYISSDYEMITGNRPGDLESYVTENMSLFKKLVTYG